ncbi:MAG: AglZ/HisF2 family acetamidino modification protein [Candidatus Paceibacterota bacterium]|jgi:cyclase
MLKTRVIPCLLLQNDILVKTIGFKNPKYIGDPINAIRIFNEKEVDELVLLDVTATIENKKLPIKILEKIAAECFMPLAYGGGIKTIEEIKQLFNLGIEKVVINSCAAENPAFIKQAAENFGSQSIVVSIDARKNELGAYEVIASSGTKSTGKNPVDFAMEMAMIGAGEIFLNSIDKDGAMTGYDVELIEKVAKAVNIPVIASGGAGKIEDFKTAVDAGASAVAAASMFVFYGKNRAVLISYPTQEELKKVLS